MFIPFISDHSSQILGKRKGGGGGGRSGGGKSSSGGSGRSSSSSSSSRSSGGGRGSRSRPSSSTISGGRTSRPYNNGGGKPTVVPAGQPFAGRSVGGGTRSQIYGSRTYGSGYPSYGYGRGVAGRGFPFYFWPLVWGGAVGVGTTTYLHASEEYGQPNNSSRPGGVQTTAAFQSNYTSTIFRITSDNQTVLDLIYEIHLNCSSHLTSNSASSPSDAYVYNETAPDAPKPEQAIQYYRASSAVLTLDGYNNSAVLGTEGTPDTPLPDGIDVTLLECLNGTIGQGILLVDGVGGRWTPPSYGIVGLLWIIWLFAYEF
ncbi:hypothetical protein K435DRAFT_964395 [Dendrothele bispora CBS 962.96]|uniref:Uncharacterized protein n=1 Tax=Dendrothele bispora (strain CBS 962.96) TaxID=1314807 RepID=A0A4S8MAV1_DENBC|nr:hypothetical protein K435DRAFT_964395 [Dendrothele bispora CBS 962.96]